MVRFRKIKRIGQCFRSAMGTLSIALWSIIQTKRKGSVMKKILVTYITNAGSTAKVAQAVADELAKTAQVEVLPLEKAADLEQYAAVVLGAPMILGWHRGAQAFLKRNQDSLSRMPVALFITCMNLTKTAETSLDGVPLFVDEKLALPPKKAGSLSFKERYSTTSNYLAPIIKAAPSVKPVSVAFFGGSLQYFNLKWWAVLFALLVIQAAPGDKRNWKAITEWAGNLVGQLKLAE
jgi:menaquinone-dependent protoporphyrinogen IX oxidase